MALLQRCLQLAQLLHTLSWAKLGIPRHRTCSYHPVLVLLLPLLLHLEPPLVMSLLLPHKQRMLQEPHFYRQVPLLILQQFLQMERIQVMSCLAWLNDLQQDLSSCPLELLRSLPPSPPEEPLLVMSLWAKLKRLLPRLPEHCRQVLLAIHLRCLLSELRLAT